MACYIDCSSEGESLWDEDEEVTSPESILLSLVQSYDWKGASARVAKFPEECKAIGARGRTPLHVACDHDAPAHLVASLLTSYPEACLMIGTSHMNPAHITCSSQHASIEIVQLLLEKGHKLQTSMQDLDGDTPLHTACRCGAPIEVLRVLLQANPGAVNERDFEGLTPLLRIWVRCFVIVGEDALSQVHSPQDITGELQLTWDKMILLLRCAHFGSITSEEEENQFQIIHAAAAVDCPRQVLEAAAILYPDQLTLQDADGMTPLALAAKAPVFQIHDLSDEGLYVLLEDQILGDDDDASIEENTTGAFPVQIESDESSTSSHQQQQQQPSVIDILLDASGTAATMTANNHGQLPLHLTVTSGKGWSEGVKQILAAYPSALSRVDPVTGFFSFQAAAMSPQADTTTIFELLRRDPSVVHASTNRSATDTATQIPDASLEHKSKKQKTTVSFS